MDKRPADVYFTDMHTVPMGDSLQTKLRKLMLKAGIGTIDFKDKFVAVKLHFGEPGNLAFLRANYARTVCDLVKELGGKPFVTDCNTLYVGGRKNALDHLETAYQNGYNPFATGVHTLIADGLKGTDDVEVPVPGGEYVKVAKIGRAVMDADIVISLNHFKGHECTGFGGAIKNIGMGCGSRAGSSTARPQSTMPNAWGAAVALAFAPRMRLPPTSTRPTMSSTARWRNTPWPSSTTALTSTSAWPLTSLPSAIAMRRTMCRLCRTSACSPPSTRWPSTAPAPTP